MYQNFYYSIFIWNSTCFGQHATHHQEPKTALAASGFSYVEGCWMCSSWTLSGSAWQRPPATRPTTFHVWKTRCCQCSFRLLMKGCVSPETCWASYKYGIKKCWYIVASCWIFFMNCAMKHGSTNIKFCSVWMFGLCSRNLPCRADKRPCELSRYFHSFSSKSWFWYLLIIGYSVDWSKDFQIYAIPLYICGIFILSCIRPVPTFYCFTSEILY